MAERVTVSQITLTYYQRILHQLWRIEYEERERERERKGDHAVERLMSLTQTARLHVGQLSEQHLGLKW